MKPVTVIATIRALPAQAAAVRSELVALLTPTRAEQGCLNYDLHEDETDASLFVFHENWRTAAHLDEHLASPHVQGCLQAIEGKIAGAEVLRLRGIGDD